jgi:HupE / UreJ protein
MTSARGLMSTVLLLWSALSPSVWAHTLSVSHLDIAVPASGGDLQLELDIAIRDLALTFPLDANRDEQVTWGELQAIRQPLEHWVASGLALSAGPSTCALLVENLAIRRYDDGAYATLKMRGHCATNDGLSVRYGLLFAGDPQHRAIITLRKGTSVTTVIASVKNQSLALGPASGHPFTDFLREGVHHILIGYDHLAFLISLLLPAALVRTPGRWSPVGSVKKSATHVLGIVTAFTLAHSVTLSLAVLGWVTPASQWVEPAIAASVVLAALNNVWPVLTRRLWAAGFFFGLVHGFGFAGALVELGLPIGARLQALVGFNVGVELGQLAVVAAVLPILFAIRKRRWYGDYVLPALSLAIAGLAAAWLYQRLVP